MQHQVTAVFGLAALSDVAHEEFVAAGLEAAEGILPDARVHGDLNVVNQELVLGVEVSDSDLNRDEGIGNAAAEDVAGFLPRKERHRATHIIGSLKLPPRGRLVHR